LADNVCRFQAFAQFHRDTNGVEIGNAIDGEGVLELCAEYHVVFRVESTLRLGQVEPLHSQVLDDDVFDILGGFNGGSALLDVVPDAIIVEVDFWDLL